MRSSSETGVELDEDGVDAADDSVFSVSLDADVVVVGGGGELIGGVIGGCDGGTAVVIGFKVG